MKNPFRRLAAVLLAVVLCLSALTMAPVRAYAAEVLPEVPPVQNAAEEAATEAPTEAAVPATEAPTEKATETPTEKATEAPTEKATEAPTEAATEAPTEAPTAQDNRQEIHKVLCSLNYEPVVYMELVHVNVSSSSTDCSIAQVSWVNSSGAVETNAFAKDTYRLMVTYTPNAGYRFAQDTVGYINNKSGDVSVSVAADGSSAVLSKSFTAAIWTPIHIKNPKSATVDAGGWTSFVTSSMYTETDEWLFAAPDGRIVTAKNITSTFSHLDVSGENTDRLVLQNIPVEMNGWKVFCRHWSVDHINYSESQPATITVKGAPEATEAPTEAATEAETEETVTEAAEEASAEEATEEAAAEEPATEAAPTEVPTVALPWKQDSSAHWHEGADGEVSDKASHAFVWRETRAATADLAGEETGTCSFCGYTETRPLAYSESAGEQGGDPLRTVLYGMLGAAGAGIVALAVYGLAQPKSKKRR